MLDTLRRMFAPNSEFLALSVWGMQLFVVAMLVREWVMAARHKRKMKRKIAGLYALMAKGHILQSEAAACCQRDDYETWSPKARAWIAETGVSLGDYSQQAATAFNRIRKSPSSQHGIAAMIGELYGDLTQYLDNGGIYFTPPNAIGCGLTRVANGAGSTCTACWARR